jgi:hypothetical protein
VIVVTHKTAECKVVIPREWIPLDFSTQQTEYRDDGSSGECDNQQNQEFCLSGLHLGGARNNKDKGDIKAIGKD